MAGIRTKPVSLVIFGGKFLMVEYFDAPLNDKYVQYTYEFCSNNQAKYLEFTWSYSMFSTKLLPEFHANCLFEGEKKS